MKYQIVRTRYNNEVVYEGDSWLDAMKAVMLADGGDEIDFIEEGKVIWNGEENTWGDLYEYDMRFHNGEYTNDESFIKGQMIP